MEAGEWKEAEQAFQASITMGDCLPQPWGNLGISAALPEIRRTGPLARIDIRDPFKSSKLKQSITFKLTGGWVRDETKFSTKK